uniref:PP2C family protein-serine/threonine phosphatase n=1 Tax=Cellulomonas endophytica TaxID=2494735 RepID=UPI0013E943EB
RTGTGAAASARPAGATAAPPASRVRRLRARLLPYGVDLPEGSWRGRHRAVLVFLGVLALVAAGWASRAHGAGGVVPAAAVLGAAGVAAAVPHHHRRLAASVASVAMLGVTAVLVHLSHGLIEMHFLFFVIVGAVTLYQQWAPFLSAVAFVVLHHGVLGTLDPASIYNHPEAIEHPWAWAGVHGGFIALMSAVGLAAWRFDELVRDELAAATAERGLSEELQRTALTAPVQPPGLEVAVRYRPAAQHARIGGDWYDAFLVPGPDGPDAPGGTLTLAIGDVAGHDRQAAGAMAQLRNLLRGVAITAGRPPAEILADLDRALAALRVGAVASAVVAQLEQGEAGAAPGHRTLRWSNAGHLPPLVVAPDGEARYLDAATDLVLGVAADRPRAGLVADLAPGSALVLYTDGLVERRGEPLAAGLERLRAALAGAPAVSAEDLCDRLLATAGAAPEDDVALLVVRLR